MFIYSEKVTKFKKKSPLVLILLAKYLVTSKISGKFLQFFIPFSENLNCTRPTLLSNGLSGYKEFSQYSSESASQFSDPLPELVSALFGIHFHICICSWATRKLFWIESPLLLCIFH